MSTPRSAYGADLAYRDRPPSLEAVYAETDPTILEGWSVRAAKRSELWRYREPLYRHPHNTVRGRHKLGRLVTLTDAERAALDAERTEWAKIRVEPPAKKTKEEREREERDDDFSSPGT